MKHEKVSPQQAEYLAKVASGRRLADIAREAHVAKETVSYQLRGLKDTIGASTLPNLVAEAINLSIIKPDSSGSGYISYQQHEFLQLAEKIGEDIQTLELGALEKVPGKQNWIERLPAGLRARWNKSIVYRAAVHMHREQGMSVGHAIASALNWARHICRTGDVKQWRGPQAVSPKSRAECCAAIALWNEMKAASKSSSD